MDLNELKAELERLKQIERDLILKQEKIIEILNDLSQWKNKILCELAKEIEAIKNDN